MTTNDKVKMTKEEGVLIIREKEETVTTDEAPKTSDLWKSFFLLKKKDLLFQNVKKLKNATDNFKSICLA